MGRRLIRARLALALVALALVGLALVACGGARIAPATDAPAPRAPISSGPDPDARASRPERVRVRVLFVAIAGRTVELAEERARMLARTARADDFSQLALEYGDGDDAANRGAAGLVLAPDDLRVAESVREAAFALEVREISSPIETDDGFWVLQRVE
ncbi:MAG: peptidylprolyl isomerase [Myxococcota bacterium]|nr:peptidylprolyl isomerase [Myxococcota bacterium]